MASGNMCHNGAIALGYPCWPLNPPLLCPTGHPVSCTTFGFKCVAALLSACWPNDDDGDGSGFLALPAHGNRVRLLLLENTAYAAHFCAVSFLSALLLLCAHMENQAKCIWQAAGAEKAPSQDNRAKRKRITRNDKRIFITGVCI